MQLVQALAALGQVNQVLMLAQNPCQYFWGDLVEGHAALRAKVRRRQSPKPSVGQPAAATHPLRVSWGPWCCNMRAVIACWITSQTACRITRLTL